ncbi:hypothetical protein [Streptomyces sp. NBC_01207]|nr:hypothetical protein OG457_27290 [Streptomyces sp. NBC_01207]
MTTTAVLLAVLAAGLWATCSRNDGLRILGCIATGLALGFLVHRMAG